MAQAPRGFPINSTAEVEAVLNKLRGAMQVDGGNVDLVSVETGIVSVRLLGTCIHCPSASLTLNSGIERTLKQELPWVKAVVRVP
jgi:Fe-S cluster biogenesis protein NfuA